jgi:DNA-binding Xre family transcriptional regulator
MVKYRIKEVLKEKGVSQGKLSRMTNVSLSTIQRLSVEGSTYNVSMDVLERIAKALGVKISDLYQEEETDK